MAARGPCSRKLNSFCSCCQIPNSNLQFGAKYVSTYAHVAVAPSLTRHPGSGELIVKKGSTVSLRCQAQGFPTPKVSGLYYRVFHNNNTFVIDKLRVGLLRVRVSKQSKAQVGLTHGKEIRGYSKTVWSSKTIKSKIYKIYDKTFSK